MLKSLNRCLVMHLVNSKLLFELKFNLIVVLVISKHLFEVRDFLIFFVDFECYMMSFVI